MAVLWGRRPSAPGAPAPELPKPDRQPRRYPACYIFDDQESWISYNRKREVLERPTAMVTEIINARQAAET